MNSGNFFNVSHLRQMCKKLKNKWGNDFSLYAVNLNLKVFEEYYHSYITHTYIMIIVQNNSTTYILIKKKREIILIQVNIQKYKKLS